MLSEILDSERLCGLTMCGKDRIIGGQVSPPCEHPWMAQIVYTKGIFKIIILRNKIFYRLLGNLSNKRVSSPVSKKNDKFFRTSVFGPDKGKTCLWWRAFGIMLGHHRGTLYNGRKRQLRQEFTGKTNKR